ncbi:hypothetical protein M434DRAFT_399639 [Hypoxylon sp. CO27-5]|nr:hypothetical protein M434DRAFT_399639 [Hypoxylon sp. CO27-5]
MSSRQLRRLQKQKELQELQAQNPADDDESSGDDRPVQKPRTSLFSGFAALEDQDDQDDDADRDEKEEESVEVSTQPVVEPERTGTPKSSSKKSKKKKKKAKKPEATTINPEAVPQSGPDEIDELLRELDLSKQSVQEIHDERSLAKPYDRVCELLSINTYHLKVINEMRNLFGREAIAAAQSEEGQEQTRSRRHRQALPEHVDLETYLKAQPGKSLPEVTLRRNPFLAGKETWPRASTEGLTMEQVKDKEGELADKPGTIEFRFVHDVKYNMLEMQFFELVQLYDPMRIVHFLHLHPYHISSLIQVSRIAKQDQNAALSADLCERALFTFGRTSISTFRQKIEQGKVRFSFRRPENRQFWLAGYHYLKNLIMKGTYRTALEWAKLLLSVDHGDPYGIIHYIHPLAIRAHESKWFIDLCDSELLQVDQAAQDSPDYIRQTLVLAKLQQKDTAGAKALLIEGMERLPWLYSHLFKSLNLDVPKAIWGMQPRNRDEELHTSVYIHQTKGLWDNTQAISLLKEAASEAKRVDASKTFPFPPTVKVNLARFVYLLEIPSLIGFIPRDLLDTSTNWEFDPLPPPLDENIFSYESQKQPFNPPSDEGNFRTMLHGERQGLQQLLAQARLAGAPIHVQQELEQAIDAIDDVDGDHDEDYDDNDGEDDDRDSDETQERDFTSRFLPVAVQALLDLLGPMRPRGATSDSMPGGWQDEESTDDEMPPLMASRHEDDEVSPLIPDEEKDDASAPTNDRHSAGDDTDDEMPELL